jgi:two-component system response regulator CpxR
MAKSKILVLGNTKYHAFLNDLLGNEGLSIEGADSDSSGLERALSGDHALVVLDGMDLLRRLRRESMVPVLMLLERGEDGDRIESIEEGADDCMLLPFNPRELVARVRALQRRFKLEPPLGDEPTGEIITVGDVRLDTGSRVVSRADEIIALTGAEFALLEALLGAAGQVLSREELTKRVLGRPFSPFDRSIDVHVSSLRKKLGSNVDGQDRIKTVRGVGYLYATNSR